MTYLTYRDLGRSRTTRRSLAGLTKLVERLREAWATWQRYRERRDAFANLLTRDDRTLSDIGVLRDEVEWAAGLPFYVDAARALHDRASGRRLAEQKARLRYRRGPRHLDKVYAEEVRRIGVPR
jgi:uncharacterized protein YjiS (DUF1127 family)